MVTLYSSVFLHLFYELTKVIYIERFLFPNVLMPRVYLIFVFRLGVALMTLV